MVFWFGLWREVKQIRGAHGPRHDPFTKKNKRERVSTNGKTIKKKSR
jgi:hypothetical protein